MRVFTLDNCKFTIDESLFSGQFQVYHPPLQSSSLCKFFNSWIYYRVATVVTSVVSADITSSRYVLGHEAMRKMAAANILVCGMGGLGAEIAKDLVLGGVKSVMLQDDQAATYQDLSSQVMPDSHRDQSHTPRFHILSVTRTDSGL